MICFHEVVFIDHHGKSCGLCGIALEGYGVASPFSGKQNVNERCLHGKAAWRMINKNKSGVFTAHSFAEETNTRKKRTTGNLKY